VVKPVFLVCCSFINGPADLGGPRKKCAMIGRVDPKALRQTFKGDAVA
jgi:hypothetical protein